MEEVFSKEVPTLLSDHFEQLHIGSAISIDVIRERQYRSTLGKKCLAELGFNRAQQRIPGIIIPLWGVNGQQIGWQYRPDNPRIVRDRVTKYENQPGSSVRLDVPPRCQPMLGDPAVPIFFAEGTKKADSLATQGACAVGLNGVWGFKGRNPLGGTTILADFDYIALKERDCFVVYDSDYATVPQVRQAQDRLVEHLRRKGANAKVIYLPPMPDGGKQGADDFLAAGQTLDALMALALEAEIEPLVSRRGYILEDKDGKGIKLDLEQLVSDLLHEYYFATLVDTREILVYRNGVWKHRGEAFIERECQRRVGDSELLTKYKVNEILGHIQRSTYCDRSLFNRERWVINLQNGLLDIRTKELKPHSPEFLSTMRIPVSYDPSADCPEIKTCFESWVKQEDIQLLEELYGYCLFAGHPIHKAILLLGDGANGKSTYLELLKTFLGSENCSTVSLQALEWQRFATARLYGKLANIYADIPSQPLKHAGRFKMLTGGDTIDGEKKFRDSFSFVNYAKLVFSTNKPPEVESEDSLAFWRRWILINFPNKFMGKDANKHLLNKLTTETELSGLLNVALARLGTLLTSGEFSYSLTPDEVATRYLRAANPVYAFLIDRCRPKGWTSKNALYQLFREYCEEKGIPIMGKEAFGRKLSNTRWGQIVSKRETIGSERITGWEGVEITEGYDED